MSCGGRARPALPPAVEEAFARLAALGGQGGRPTPAVTASIMVALPGSPALLSDATLRRDLTYVDGMFGLPADQIDARVLRSGDELARSIAAFGAASGLVISVTSGDCYRQTELVAQARARLP